MDHSSAHANAGDVGSNAVTHDGAARPSKAQGKWIGLLKLALLLTLVLSPLPVWADGGVVRTRAVREQFVVTLFTPPQVVASVPTELAVLVQKTDTSEVLLDAEVEFSLVPPMGVRIPPNEALCGSLNRTRWPADGSTAHRVPRQATHAQAANRLLYGTVVTLAAPGDWLLQVAVRHGGSQAAVTCTLPVAEAPHRGALLWPAFLVPPAAISLFALNQWLRRRPFRLAMPTRASNRS
jgi:hypothetical protein